MEEMALKRASSSPHIHAGRTVQGVMLEVIVALAPAGVFGVYTFGWRALLIIAVSVLSASSGMAVRSAWRKSPARSATSAPWSRASFWPTICRSQCPCGCP